MKSYKKYIAMGSMFIIIATFGFLIHITMIDNQIKNIDMELDSYTYNLGRSEARINIARIYAASIEVLIEMNASKEKIDYEANTIKGYYIQSIEASYQSLNQEYPSEELKNKWKMKTPNELVELSNDYIRQSINLQQSISDERSNMVYWRNIIYTIYSLLNVFGLLSILMADIKKR